MPLQISNDNDRWAAVARRDRTADGAFYVAVKTTGIYCRPSCSGRPLRKNVRFVATPAEAEAAGFRACKRCKPNEARM
jgi:methylphosphotriester-DNA--protein-cysteine methyltransferase